MIRSFGVPPERFRRNLVFKGEFKVKVEPGITFSLVSHGDHIENDLFWNGYGYGWEGNCLQVWREVVRDADFIADIGANTGVFALTAQALRPNARVLAVEPSARVFLKLERNIELNGFPIVALSCAASDRTGAATFYDVPHEHQYTASLEPAMRRYVATLGLTDSTEETVPTARLDDIFELEGFEQLNAMKLDVEMHEPAVLRGCRATLEKHRPTMLVEVLNKTLLQEIEQVLAGLDYRFRRVREDGHGSERNYLFAQNSKMAEIEARVGRWLA